MSDPYGVPPKKRRWWLIIGIPVVVVVLLIAGATSAVLLVNRGSGAGDGDQAARQVSAAAKQGRLTDAQLQKVDATDLYYAVFKTMVQRSLLHTKVETTTPGGQTGAYFRHDMTTDLRTKKYSYQSELAEGSGTSVGSFRCVGAKLYYSDASDGQRWHDWANDPGADNKKCTNLTEVESYISDGMATGGLTGPQADLMVHELRRYDTFMRASQVKLADRNGKRYLRFAVQVTPVKLEDGNYYGMQRFTFGFKETGLDPGKHPYGNDGAVSGGIRFVMYVDPVTLLPAYSQSALTPSVDRDGKPEPADFDTSSSLSRVEYDFTQRQVFTLGLGDYDPIVLSWKAEAFPPQRGDWKP